MRALALALLLLVVPSAAFARGKHKKKAVPVQIHPFADVPLAKLQVADTRGAQAVVEDKRGGGDVVLVRAGDRLGEEGFEVVKVTRGCLQLKGAEAELTICADGPEGPATERNLRAAAPAPPPAP